MTSSGAAPLRAFGLDGLLAAVWEAWEQDRFVVQRCDSCTAVQWPPRSRCVDCRSADLRFVDAPRLGQLYSWTVTHRAPTPEWQGFTPYVVVVVELTAHPGVRYLGGVDLDPAECRIGLPLEVEFRHGPAGRRLPYWRAQVDPVRRERTTTQAAYPQ